MSFPVLSPEEARRVLAGLPRLSLAHLPTPLDEAPRFAERIGGGLPAVFAYRDDLLPDLSPKAGQGPVEQGQR